MHTRPAWFPGCSTHFCQRYVVGAWFLFQCCEQMNPNICWIGDMVGPIASQDILEKRKSSPVTSNWTLSCLAYGLVPIPSTLSWLCLPFLYYSCYNHLNMFCQSLTVSLLKQFIVKIFFWLCLHYFELFKITSTMFVYIQARVLYIWPCMWLVSSVLSIVSIFHCVVSHPCLIKFHQNFVVISNYQILEAEYLLVLI
jgi:hypothetical protein